MKLKLLAAACGLALGGQAFALTPAVTDAAGTVKIYATGSSAAGRVLVTLSSSACQTGTADYYQLGSDTGNVFGVSCTLKTDQGGGAAGLGGKNVFFAYNAAGGSAYGYYSVAKATVPSTGLQNTDPVQVPLLKRFELANLSVSGNCLAAVPSIAPNPGNTYTCTSTASVWPDIGITDTEPGLHNIPINTPPELTAAGITSVSDDETAQLDSAVAFQQVFGIAVSQALYNDLQSTQVALGQISAGGVPSLSKSAVANYMSGSFSDWQPLFATAGTMPAKATSAVNICTRTPGSGSKSAANAFFLDNPCGAGMNPAPASALGSSPYVQEFPSTSGVKTCLTAFGTSAYAIGIIGHDNAAGTDSQYVAIDGVVPSRDNAKNGLYDWFVESFMQWNGANLALKSLPSGVNATNVANYLADFRTRAGSPDVMAQFTPAQADGVLAISNFGTISYNPKGNDNNAKFASRVTKLGSSCAPTLWNQ